MADSLPKTIPLPGSLHLRPVRCGKPNCKCSRGELHTAYYRIWYERRRLRKQYARKSELELVRQAIALWHEREAAMKQILESEDGQRVKREIKAMLRSACGDQYALAMRQIRSKL